jgi:hypothetical protein
VFVLNELKSSDNETAFDRNIRQLKHDPSALNNHIVNLLETQINGNLKDEILYYRKVQALFPIISILLNDKTKVEIFVQIKTHTKISQDGSSLLSTSEESIHGVRKTTAHF